MKIPVLRNVFEKNEYAAAHNRTFFDEQSVTCINILGGAGAGKTALLEALLPKLQPELQVGVLEGDLATTKDATRIANLGVPVVQLLTDGGCHLTATLVKHGLGRLPLSELDLLIVENVGNPICPANFDLGEHLRISVLSVAEGDDKPAKYPLLFKDSSLIVISKCDLLEHTDFSMESAARDIRRLAPDMEIIETAARKGTGIDRLSDWVTSKLLPRHNEGDLAQ